MHISKLPQRHVGLLLVEFRHQHAEHLENLLVTEPSLCEDLTASEAVTPAVDIDASTYTLVAALRANDYHVTVPEYLGIELGVLFPSHLARFLGAVFASLALSEQERCALVVQIAFDLLSRELGEDLARQCLQSALAAINDLN
jgi:hypothetical protein